MPNFFERKIKTVLHSASSAASAGEKMVRTGTRPARDRQVPPGFDAASYLSINPDVAEAYAGAADLSVSAEDHYLKYGRAEMRRVFRDGEGIVHPQSRLLDEDLRDTWGDDWRGALETLVAQPRYGSFEAVMKQHPRAGWLEGGFSLASYMARHPRALATIATPDEMLFHFLEFGLEEGDHGRPDDWDPALVRSRYGIAPAEGTRTSDVFRDLRRQRRTGLLPLTVAELWAAYGLSGELMEDRFDHEYYHAVALREGMPPPDIARHVCASHFCETGCAQGLPIRPDLTFDAQFYSETYGEELAGIPAAGPLAGEAQRQEETVALYDWWLRRGLARGHAPNLASWAETETGIVVPEAILRQLGVYRLATPALKDETRQTRILRHLTSAPVPGIAALTLSDSTAIAFLVELADKKAVSGDAEVAEWLYWMALDEAPDNSRARRHLADLLQRQNRRAEVLPLRKNVPISFETGWNALALAEVYLQFSRVAQAASILNEARKVVQADVIMRNKCAELARQLFDHIWSDLGAYVGVRGVAETQAHLTAALAACTPPYSPVKRAKPIRRVALVGNDDLYQCKLYRVDQKAEQLRAAGYEIKIFSPQRDLDRFRAEVDNFDAAIFFRVAAFPPMIEAITQAAQHGLSTFYEIDDLIFDPTEFPPPLETYANQITQAEYDAMACGVPLFEHAMRLCDYGIASTATIAEAMATRVRTGQVFEHHNALGRLHLTAIRDAAARPPRDPKAPLVIFYGSGTKAHREDFHNILEPALARVLKKYPRRVELRLIGYFDRFRHLDRKKDPIRMIEPIWDFEEFCATVAQADINLSVLARTPVTDAKSEIKWMEAAMFGVPSVVSATRTHRETIEDGVTGMLCDTTKDFEKALISLIEDADLRRRIGTAARDTVMERYAVSAMGDNLARIFAQIRPEEPPKKRLLVVNVFYPPQAIGGATRVVHDNVSLLREHYGHEFEIDVIATLEGGHVPYEVNVHAVDGVRVWTISTPHLPDLDKIPQDPHMGEVFERLVQRIRPDLIHFHCIQRLTAAVADVARLNDIPYLITAHDGWWISPNQFLLDSKDRIAFYDYEEQGTGRLPPRAAALYRPLAGAAHVLAVSEPFARIYRDCGVPDVLTVENGVSGLPECRRVPSENGRVRLAHIGGVSRHKGYHLVRNALMANRYDNLELLLVDHALQPGTVLREIWGTTPVTIIAKVSQSEVAALYGRIDVLLAPSIWPESYGLVTREAMATGAWVVASDRGAIGADIAEGVNGHVVDVSTYAGLAEVLVRIDKAPETYRAAPAERPAIRTARDQVADLAALYHQIIGSPAETPDAETETGAG